MAEKFRAGGAGIPAFFTPTGAGTIIEEGGFPIRCDPTNPKKALIPSEKKERRHFDGRDYILERSIVGDFSLIKAWKAD